MRLPLNGTKKNLNIFKEEADISILSSATVSKEADTSAVPFSVTHSLPSLQKVGVFLVATE